MDVQKVRVRYSNRSSPVFNNCTVHLWWLQVRRLSGKKILQGQRKVREFHFESGKIELLERSQGKVKF